MLLSPDYNFLGLWHRPSGPNISQLFAKGKQGRREKKKLVIQKKKSLRLFEGEYLWIPRLETALASHRGSWPSISDCELAEVDFVLFFWVLCFLGCL